MPITLDLMPLEERLPEPPPAKTLVVRYGYLREIGEFPSDLTAKVICGTQLIVRTDRGIEIGEMLTTTCGNAECSKSITRDKLSEYIQHSGGRNYPFTEQGQVLRVATAQDLAEQAKLDENRHQHLLMARELVTTHRLPMKVVDVEHILGGERILFYFVSEHRVDFRSLVRDLAQDLHTRIELRQVGARDEARLTADYEKCGQHCCCKQFLKVLTPISMRAAKVQKATLDPTKISGRCGRLMCCLRYEDQMYEELRKKLPKRNTRVRTESGDAWVIDGQILTQLVLLQSDDGKREAVPLEKVLEFDRPKPVIAGRTMQTPNDRPPPAFSGEGPGPARRGNGLGMPIARRPAPGGPVETPDADPRALDGPTGGDLNPGTEPGADAAPGTGDIDDLLADAMEDPPLPPAVVQAESESSDDPWAQPAPPPPPPPPPLPQPGRGPAGAGGGGRMPENRRPENRPPQNRGRQNQQKGPRPDRPMGGRGQGPQGPGRNPGGGRPPQQRGPQPFRPPQAQQPRPAAPPTPPAPPSPPTEPPAPPATAAP